MSSLAKECGISSPTVKSWLSALENSYVIFLLQPYYRNFSKRVTKSPKLYFHDTGLLCHLLRINDVSQMNNQSVKGALFENMVISEYVKKRYHKNERQTDLWFWRDSHGNEVDLLIEKPRETEIVEIKATRTVMPDPVSYTHLDVYKRQDTLFAPFVKCAASHEKCSISHTICKGNICTFVE